MLATSEAVLLAFLLFCRIGSCLMLMPGVASPRVPAQVRLFIAIAVTLALTPMLMPELSPKIRLEPAILLRLVVAETMAGVLIGLLGRLFFLALQFMASALASFIGYAGMPDVAIDDSEPAPAVASLVTVTATVLFFAADLHWEVLRGLVRSYAVVPVERPITPDIGLERLVTAATDAFVLTLQITSPFVVYTFAINLTFGIVNKLTPQLPVYFISLPFVLAGGLLLLYFVIAEVLTLFTVGISGWLQRG